MSSVHGTIRFREETERLVVVRRTEDTEEGAGGVLSVPRLGERRKRRSLSLAWLRGIAGVLLFIVVSFFALFTPS